MIVSRKTRLTNGFRSIKEFLVQSHNARLQADYNTLEQKNVTVLSIKTDAFIILSKHVGKAKQILTFDDNIGSRKVFNEGKM